jgi:predicted transcriptional regulator of viral defense system
MDLDNLEPVFRLDEAVAAGISKERVYRLRDAGDIEAVGHGTFLVPGSIDPAVVPLAVASARQPLATMCLTSALVHHNLSDDIPQGVDIALPRNTRPPAGVEHAFWHSFARATFEIGRNEAQFGRVRLGVYSSERSIIDAFVVSHVQGSDVAYEALRRWLRKRGNNASQLLLIAREFPTAGARIRRALEVLQ